MQVVIISGKGGTGKTTIASSLAYLSENKIKVDCDVDASNLHLILKGKDLEKHDFIGAKVAKINLDKCTRCLKCMEVCRYDAIKDCKVNEMLCEGCGACKIVCEYDAIELKDEITGQTIITETDKGILSRAEMEAGAEGSGKLVTEVRKNAMKYYKENELVILDGSPGIGCAVMASITGCDIALIVTEPTQSGLEDFMRVLATVKYFGVKPIVCINKFDINTEMSSKIEEFCEGEAIEIVGKIPFDEYANKAINELKPIVAYKDSIAGKEIINMWNKIKKLWRLFSMKVAIAKEGNLVSAHFGHCEGFEVYEIENNEIVSKTFVENPGHRPGFLPKYLAERNVNVIISGGMGANAQEIFRRNNIEVIVGASGELENVIKEFIDGKLKTTNSVCHEHKHHDSCGNH